MSFLARIFGGKNNKSATAEPAPAKPALAELSADALFDVIRSQNQSINTKLEAIEHLPAGKELTQLVGSDVDNKVQAAGAKRLASLLDDETLSLDSLQAELSNDQCLIIAGYAKNNAFISQLIESNLSENQLSELAVEGSSSKIRQAAATKLNSVELLQGVSKNIKGKDKTVYKIVKDKLETHRSEEKQRQAIHTQLENLCESLISLSKTIDTATLAQRLARIENEWQALVNSIEQNPFLTTYETNLEICKNRVEQIKQEEEKRQAKERAEAAAKDAFKFVIDELQAFLASLYNANEIDIDFAAKSTEVVESKQNDWHQALNAAKPTKDQADLFNKLIDAVGRLIIGITQKGSLSQLTEKLQACEEERALEEIQKNIADILLPAKLLKPAHVPTIVDQTRAAIAEFQAKIEQQHEAEQAQIRLLIGLIRKVNNSVASGNLRQASGLRKAIDEKIELIEHLPSRIEAQIEELDEGINKLQDYRNFATEPKKRELIAEMQKLADTAKSYTEKTLETLDRENLADKIKKLQSDWKELVYGGKDTQPELWDEFHALSQIAFEPCKEFFSEKAEERQQNLEKRKEILTQLNMYLEKNDWENADWKEVEKLLRTAKQEWSHYTPVERAANAPVQKAFNSTLKSIQAYVDAEYEKNKNSKANIVELAKELEKMENTQDAIAKVKQLQAQWKTCGRTWQREENKLWKAFRGYCDAVFDRKQKESDAFKTELENNRKAAENTCEQVEALSKLSGKALVDGRESLDAAKEAFAEIHPLPKNAEKSIKARFNNALEAFDRALTQQRASEENQAWENVLACKPLLNQWQNASLAGDAEEAKSALIAAIDAIEKWPGKTKGILTKLAQASVDADSLEANAQTMRMLCIQLETVMDIPSPDSDKALRMEYQVNRLKEGMISSGSLSKQEQVEKIIIEWLATGPVADTDFDAFDRRFNKARH